MHAERDNEQRWSVAATFVGAALLAGVLLAALSLASGCSPIRPETRAARVAQAAAHCDRARADWFAGRSDAARAELERAIALAPDDAEAHRLLGVLYLGRSDGRDGDRESLRRSLAHLERAVTLAPSFHAARADLATALAADGRYEEAAALFRALTETPDYETPAVAHAGLASALYHLGRHREAARHYEIAIAYDPGLCRSYASLGLAYEALGKRTRALDAYEEAVRRCGDRTAGAPPLFGMLEPTR